MFPVATLQGGQCMGMPDVCLTPAPPAPPIPVPYPNIGNLMQAIPPTCSKKVLIMNQPAILLGSMVSMTSGDEAGAAGGVMSGMIKGPASFKKGSTKLIIEGQPAVLMLATTGQNSTNVPAGTLVQVSQMKVICAG